jgi:hypothetical protein
MVLEEYVLNYVLLYVLLESYEIWWQKAGTLLGILARMYEQYRKNIWVFLLMQPTFYFGIIFVMLCDYNIYSVILISIKASDVLTKIVLLKKVFIQREVSVELSQVLLVPINQIFIYLGLIIYPVLIVLALTS